MSILDGVYWEKEMKPKTNYDRFMAMKPEQLANFLAKHYDCDHTECPVYNSGISCACGCSIAWLNWLKSSENYNLFFS